MSVLIAGTAVAEGLQPYGSSGGWSIFVDPENGNGCLMQRQLESGTLVQIGVVPDRKGAFFAVYNESWTSVEVGAEGQVLLDFGDSRFQGGVVGASHNELPGGYAFFNNPEFASEFGRRFDVTIVGENGGREVIDLTGSMVALNAVRNCQEQQN